MIPCKSAVPNHVDSVDHLPLNSECVIEQFACFYKVSSHQQEKWGKDFNSYFKGFFQKGNLRFEKTLNFISNEREMQI